MGAEPDETGWHRKSFRNRYTNWRYLGPSRGHPGSRMAISTMVMVQVDAEHDVEEEGEHNSLIELSDRRRLRGHVDVNVVPIDTKSRSSNSRWTPFGLLLCLFALAFVYHLGLQEGENEVRQEGDEVDVEKKENADAGSFTFTLDRLKATRDEANKLITLLDDYYTNTEQATNM